MPTYYGNNKRISSDGQWTIYDTEMNVPSGDPREKCGNNGTYRFRTRNHTSRVSGYCLRLPGNPAGYDIQGRPGSIVHTSYEPNKTYPDDAIFKLAKEEQMDFPEDLDIG